MSSPKQNEVSADPTVAPEAPARIVWPTTSCFSAYDKHPVQMLQDRASELSGVSREQATEIDDINIGEKIGEFQMMQMIEGFSKRVLNDKDEWFRCMFSGTEDYVQNLNEYILQRLGGPSYYSDRKGTPGLIAKHASYEMSPRTAERWLEYMDETLEEEEKIGQYHPLSACVRVYVCARLIL
jgi:truncated hemoglobin YjbI